MPDCGVARNRICGTCLNWIAISDRRFGRRFPERRKNGTPAQRQLSTHNFMATKVSVVESLGTPLAVAMMNAISVLRAVA